MPAKFHGDFKALQRRVRRGLERGLRDLTLEAKRQIQRENPVDTGRSRNAWTTRFFPARLRGLVSNNVRYIRIVALGGTIPAHTVRDRRARALKFTPRGGSQPIFRKAVRIPARTVPSTPKECRNLGFHLRGRERPWGEPGSYCCGRSSELEYPCSR